MIPVTVDDAYAVVSTNTSDAMYFTYASVVDQASGDPTLILPMATSSDQPVYVPASANLGGSSGTNWRTDLEVHNPGQASASFTVELLRRDQANPSPSQASFNLQGGHSVRYENVLRSLFSFTGAAALRVTPNAGTISVTSRTYNDVPGGTFGQFIPGYSLSQALTTGAEARLIQLSRSSSGAIGCRTNIGFTEAAGVSTEIDVTLYAGSGQLLGTVPVTLRPYEHTQINDVFGEVSEDPVDDGYAVIRTQTRSAAYFAYASVVDNRSGDPIYRPATATPDWIAVPGVWVPTELRNVSVYSLATDPYDTARVMVGTKGHGLHMSNDWGARWTRLSTGLEEDEVLALAFSSTTPDTVFAGTWHQEVGNQQGEIYRSIDGGATWSKEQFALLRALSVHPEDETVIMAGTQGEGVYRSDDGGEVWSQSNDGLGNPYVKALAFAASKPSRVFAATENGIDTSDDAGVSWSHAGLSAFFDCVVVHPGDDSIVYAARNSMNGGYLYVSEDGGTTWAQVESAPLQVRSVLIDPLHPDTLIVGTADNGVFTQQAAGGAWVPLNDGLTDPRIYTLALSSGSPRFLYAGTAGDWNAIGDGAVFVMQLPE